MITIICNKCNAKIIIDSNFIGNTASIVFQKGKMDTMTIMCLECNWTEIIPITWSLSINNKNIFKI